jgi:hypothetical protein
MPEDASNHKDVFAHFGRATYYAQCFEMELKNIFMLSVHAGNRALSFELLEQCESILDKQTLGMLLRDIRKLASFDDGCVSALETALSNRNRMMHGFFGRHATDLLSHRGRESTIDELQGYTRTFQIADTVSKSVSMALCKILGIGEEQIQAEFQKLKDDADNNDRNA